MKVIINAGSVKHLARLGVPCCILTEDTIHRDTNYIQNLHKKLTFGIGVLLVPEIMMKTSQNDKKHARLYAHTLILVRAL